MHRLRLLFQVVVEALFLVELMEQTLEVVVVDEKQAVDCVVGLVVMEVHLMRSWSLNIKVYYYS